MPPFFGDSNLQDVSPRPIVEDAKTIIVASVLQVSTTKPAFEKATAFLVASTAEDVTLKSLFGNADATVASFKKELNSCSFLENVASTSPTTRTNTVTGSTPGTAGEHVIANAPQDFSPETVLRVIEAFLRKLADACSGLWDTIDWPVVRTRGQYSSETILKTIKAFFWKLADAFSGFWHTIDWPALRARARCFVDTTWTFIENNRLLSPQKSAGYGLLILCCCPQGIIAVLMLPIIISVTVIHLFGLVILNLLGFTLEGVRAFSMAASYQAHTYGAITPAGSTFSRFQSMGARGSSASHPGDVSSVAVVLRLIAGLLGIYLIIDDFLCQSAQ